MGCTLNLAPMSSATATLVMGDALAAILIKRRDFKPENFAVYHPGGSLGRRLLMKVRDIMKKGEEIPVCDKSIFELIAEYSAGTISPVDAELLRERLESDADAMRLFREIRESEKMLKSVQAHEKIDLQVSWKHLEDSLAIQPRKGRWLLWTIGSVVAASVALLLMFVFQFTRQAEQPETLVSQMGITPGGVKAILQYEDGKTIDLTSSTSSRIVTSDGLVLVNDSLKGLRFDQGELENRPMKYHTLAVPVGGEYHFTLADGTRVWVNSASEVRFPNCFSGERREIYVKGEVYLEVVRDEEHPFVVHAGENEVRVLGTRFNLTAYPDEQKVVTTLVEGSVEFRIVKYSVETRRTVRVGSGHEQARKTEG